jgi:hypothetical protein
MAARPCTATMHGNHRTVGLKLLTCCMRKRTCCAAVQGMKTLFVCLALLALVIC